jgi:hypothetical protein
MGRSTEVLSTGLRYWMSNTLWKQTSLLWLLNTTLLKQGNFWTYKSSAMWHCVAQCVAPDGLKDHSVFILRVKQSKKTGPFDPEDEGTMILWLISSHSPITQRDTAEDLYLQQHYCENLRSHRRAFGSWSMQNWSQF